MALSHHPHLLDENIVGHSQEDTFTEQYPLKHFTPNIPNVEQPPNPSYPAPVSWRSAFSRSLSPPIVIPVVVVIVNAMLLIFSWTFFAFTIIKPRPLPVSLATPVQDNIQQVVAVIGIIASGIQLVSAALYQRAIRYSLARFLAKGVSLFNIGSAVRLSQRSLIMNFKQPLWTFAAALCLLAVGTQSSGWTALLIPRTITIESPIAGDELDLKSLGFRNLAATSGLPVTSDGVSLVISEIQASGSIAVGSFFNLPGILSFNRFAYANSTMGIMPLSTVTVVSTVTSVTGHDVSARVKVHVETPKGFPVTFDLAQQGFTAQVSCQQRVVNNTTSPSLVLHPLSYILPSGSTARSPQLEVRCAGATNSIFSTPVLTSVNIDAVFGVACPVNQTDKRTRWDLILSGSGKYSFIPTTICSIFPEINMVNVTYTGDTSSPPRLINSSQSWGGQDAPWLGNFSVGLFLEALQVGQSVHGNLIGDIVQSFIENLSSDFNPGVLDDILAQYVRGSMELAVTILRTAYTEEDNELYPGRSSVIPANMRSNVSGRYWAQTIGWSQSPGTAAGVLSALTFVSLTSILIIAVTLMKKGGEPEDNRYFDPGDLIHVISAASPGGFILPAYDANTADYSNSITVTLASDGSRSRFTSSDSALFGGQTLGPTSASGTTLGMV